MTINSLIIDFLEYMEIERGNAVTSVSNYDRYLKRFAGFAKSKGVEEPEKIDSELLRQYHLYLHRLPASPAGGPDASGENPIAKVTANYHLIALRAFLKYLGKRRIAAPAPGEIELAKTDERQINFLETDELNALLAQPNQKTIQGVRDKAILDLLFSTGLRISELCNLKIDDINLEKSEFSVKGKGGKVRVVFLDHEAKESLSRYLAGRDDKNEHLFISYGHRNKPVTNNQLLVSMTPRSVQRMIHKYAKMAGLSKKVTPHTIRHSFATDLLQSGADLRSVQELLGHSSITTTQIYTHVTDRHLSEVHQAFHGLRRRSTQNEK